ncbi:hypothetical protein L1987_70514 [Smallanthus sonchifolius]|uniref:Uncharacterized protein n=1 Tax=Smallanthus sonchifolius TaxID=185202 RepID=A0ACB9APX0_9ASTR|nr:hypothetical protein L1987_70514 [Smallanthus sonchifolius]
MKLIRACLISSQPTRFSPFKFKFCSDIVKYFKMYSSSSGSNPTTLKTSRYHRKELIGTPITGTANEVSLRSSYPDPPTCDDWPPNRTVGSFFFVRNRRQNPRRLLEHRSVVVGFFCNCSVLTEEGVVLTVVVVVVMIPMGKGEELTVYRSR